MHETFVIKTDPEGKFVYTNIMISKTRNVLLNVYRAYFPNREYEILAHFASLTVVYQKLQIECTSEPRLLGNLLILTKYMHIIQISSPSIYNFLISVLETTLISTAQLNINICQSSSVLQGML